VATTVKVDDFIDIAKVVGAFRAVDAVTNTNIVTLGPHVGGPTADQAVSCHNKTTPQAFQRYQR
jgi:hypothetical protein